MLGVRLRFAALIAMTALAYTAQISGQAWGDVAAVDGVSSDDSRSTGGLSAREHGSHRGRPTELKPLNLGAWRIEAVH